jgi:hypothetical protein
MDLTKIDANSIIGKAIIEAGDNRETCVMIRKMLIDDYSHTLCVIGLDNAKEIAPYMVSAANHAVKWAAK